MAGSDNLDAATQTPVAEDPENKIPKDDLPGIVGIYWGGRQCACGTLHPTGHCMMRNEHGASLGDIAEVLNHASTDTTRKHYAFTSSERKRKIVQSFAL